MNIIDVKKYDVINGQGVRTSIWFSGCNNHCKGCWSQHTWNPKNGKPFSEWKGFIDECLNDEKTDGVSILGGDPLFHVFNSKKEEYQELIDLLKDCKEHGKSIWIWSGYNINEIKDKEPLILEYADVIIDGKYDESKRDLNLNFRGSSNQIIWEKDKDGIFVKSKLNN